MPDAVHLHYAPSPDDVIFAGELEEMAATHPRYRWHPHYTRDAGGASRHFTPRQLEQVCPDWRTREVWACGPPALLAALETFWDAAGLCSRLHLERFVAPLAPPADAAGGMASFALSQTRVTADGATPPLLVAERVGSARPRLPHGHCYSCDVMLQSGCVRDLRGASTRPVSGCRLRLRRGRRRRAGAVMRPTAEEHAMNAPCPFRSARPRSTRSAARSAPFTTRSRPTSASATRATSAA